MIKLKPFVKPFILLLLSHSAVFSQQFTWRKGSDTINQTASYGTIGLPAAGNNPGGREGAASWMDAAGNLWLFGGYGYAGNNFQSFLCDLWKYTPATHQWTWVHGVNSSSGISYGVYGTQGVAAATNNPGGRSDASCWTDASGNFWLFGGNGYNATSNDYLNDVWKYDINTNMWTWIKGSTITVQNGILIPLNGIYGTQGVAATANTPGGRYNSTTWADGSGNVWIYGGLGYDHISTTFGDLGDLWKYNTTSNQWTWVSGSNTKNLAGNWGTQGIASPVNSPGAREAAASWTDASGNFWLFGGLGFGAGNTYDLLSDLWMYSPTVNQWTWVNGSNAIDQYGSYGTQGVPSSTTMPGARIQPAGWTDASGNLWLFGGYGSDFITGQRDFNDLWKYAPATNQWTWIDGTDQTMQPGIYGVMGTAAAGNIPGARECAACWNNTVTNTVWLMGGYGYGAHTNNTGYLSIGTIGYLNDLWSFGQCTTQTLSVTSSSNTVCAGQNATLTASGAASYNWSTLQTGSVVTVTTSATAAAYTVTSDDPNGCGNYTTFTQAVAPGPALSVIQTTSISCAGDAIELIAAGAYVYVWSNDQNNVIVNDSVITAFPLLTTNYAITGTASNGCTGTFTVSQRVDLCTGIKGNGNASANVQIYPNPNNGSFTIKLNASAQKSQLSIFNAIGQKVFEQELNEETLIDHKLPNGVYFYNVSQAAGSSTANGKLIVE